MKNIIKKIAENKIIIIAVLMLFCFLAGILIDGNSFFRGGAIGSFIKTSEKYFDTGKIEYEEILYFHPFKGGPRGKGDGFIVIKLNEKSKQSFNEYAEDKLYRFPMPQQVEEYAFSVMSNENLSYSLPKLQNGYYGFFSVNKNSILTNSEIEDNLDYREKRWDYDEEKDSVVTPDDILLDSCMYMQYEKQKSILYIWEYSR